MLKSRWELPCGLDYKQLHPPLSGCAVKDSIPGCIQSTLLHVVTCCLPIASALHLMRKYLMLMLPLKAYCPTQTASFVLLKPDDLGQQRPRITEPAEVAETMSKKRTQVASHLLIKPKTYIHVCVYQCVRMSACLRSFLVEFYICLSKCLSLLLMCTHSQPRHAVT